MFCTHFYRPRMQEGNVFTLPVCVCLSVCLSIQAITFECPDKETSFLVWWYILTISRTYLSTKVIGQGQGHFCKIDYSDCWTPHSLPQPTYDINMIIKDKVIPELNFKCLDFSPKAGGGPSTRMHSSCDCNCNFTI